MFAGAVAGCLGALLGIGGGVFLIPFLNSARSRHARRSRHQPDDRSRHLERVAAGSVNRDVINLRLGIMLQIPAVAGGLIGAESVESCPDRTLYMIFAR